MESSILLTAQMFVQSTEMVISTLLLDHKDLQNSGLHFLVLLQLTSAWYRIILLLIFIVVNTADVTKVYNFQIQQIRASQVNFKSVVSAA